MSGKICDSGWSEVNTQIIDQQDPTVEQRTLGPTPSWLGCICLMMTHARQDISTILLK